MFTRALIVLLLMLNLGVALWWVARPVAVPAASPLSTGTPSLRLLAEAPARPAAKPGVPADVSPAGPLACFRLGPYAVEATALASRAALLRWGAARADVRASASAIRGWNVSSPALADQDAAQAMAARIREAGFEDLLVMPGTDGAHGIALGRYGSEASARQRVASLRSAGFEAQASPITDAGTTRWLDVALPAGREVLEARRVGGAANAEVIACGGVERPAGAPR